MDKAQTALLSFMVGVMVATLAIVPLHYKAVDAAKASVQQNDLAKLMDSAAMPMDLLPPPAI